MATVREKGYSHWDGRLQDRRFPWGPIARTGVLLAFRKKRFKILFAGAFSPAFFFLVGLYVSERLEDFRSFVRGSNWLLNIGPSAFSTYYFTSDFLLFLIVLVLAYGAGGLIADDLRHGSLQLYFARPLGRKDYVAGKMAVVAFFVLLYTALPGLVLIAFKLIFAGSFKFVLQYPWLPLSVIGYAALLTVFFAFYIMLMSAVSKNNRYVFVLVFGVYYFSAVLYGILRGVFHTPYMALFSIPANLKQAGAALFGQKPPLPVPAVWSFAVLAALCLLAAAVLDRKIRSVEVIK